MGVFHLVWQYCKGVSSTSCAEFCVEALFHRFLYDVGFIMGMCMNFISEFEDGSDDLIFQSIWLI